MARDYSSRVKDLPSIHKALVSIHSARRKQSPKYPEYLFYSRSRLLKVKMPIFTYYPYFTISSHIYTPHINTYTFCNYLS